MYKKYLSLFLLLLMNISPLFAEDELKIMITEGVVGAKPVAIVPFEGASALPENV